MFNRVVFWTKDLVFHSKLTKKALDQMLILTTTISTTPKTIHTTKEFFGFQFKNFKTLFEVKECIVGTCFKHDYVFNHNKIFASIKELVLSSKISMLYLYHCIQQVKIMCCMCLHTCCFFFIWSSSVLFYSAKKESNFKNE